MSVVAIQPGSNFTYAKAQFLFDATNYAYASSPFRYFDISADGKRFLMIKNADATTDAAWRQVTVRARLLGPGGKEQANQVIAERIDLNPQGAGLTRPPFPRQPSPCPKRRARAPDASFARACARARPRPGSRPRARRIHRGCSWFHSVFHSRVGKKRSRLPHVTSSSALFASSAAIAQTLV